MMMDEEPCLVKEWRERLGTWKEAFELLRCINSSLACLTGIQDRLLVAGISVSYWMCGIHAHEKCRLSTVGVVTWKQHPQTHISKMPIVRE